MVTYFVCEGPGICQWDNGSLFGCGVQVSDSE